MKLPEAVKTVWLEALRSGKYRQAQNTLYDPVSKGFCCLGVLEHCMLNGEVEKEFDVNSGYFAALPSVKFWDNIGLQGTKESDIWEEHNYVHDGYSTDTLIYTGGPIAVLSNMNDDGDDFAAIADWIEENVEAY